MPTMKDRAMQVLSLQALDPSAETLADPNSYGFRKERSCADAMEQCATVLSNGTRPQWILEGDIKSCFDKSSHPWWLSHIPMEKTILHIAPYGRALGTATLSSRACALGS